MEYGVLREILLTELAQAPDRGRAALYSVFVLDCPGDGVVKHGK